MPWAAAVAVIGAGLSTASGLGAFNGKVDKWNPTGEELEASRAALDAFRVGQNIQRPLDKLARQDIRYLGSDAAVQQAGALGVNQAAAALYPQAGQRLYDAAVSAGGPGSGRYFAMANQGANMIDRGYAQASAAGRLGGLSNYLNAGQQFLGRRQQDLSMGLAGLAEGAGLTAQGQASLINAQRQTNLNRNNFMGGVGGMMMSFGQQGMQSQSNSAPAQASTSSYSPAFRGAETGTSVFQNNLQGYANRIDLRGAVP